MKRDIQGIDEELIWQMLELVASADCEIDTDELARCLNLIINGSEDDRHEGVALLRKELERYLP